ncbi:hypothetical protein Tco_0004290 [Tanacetum coccineum]
MTTLRLVVESSPSQVTIDQIATSTLSVGFHRRKERKQSGDFDREIYHETGVKASDYQVRKAKIITPPLLVITNVTYIYNNVHLEKVRIDLEAVENGRVEGYGVATWNSTSVNLVGGSTEHHHLMWDITIYT